MTTPYEVGRNIGSSFGEAFGSVRKEQRENSALDEILGNALRSNDPQVLNDTLGQIIKRVAPEKQQAALGIVQNKLGQMKEKADRERKATANRAAGLPEGFEELPPTVQAQYLKNQQPKKEEAGSLAALESVKRMREIQSTGHLGAKVQGIGTGRKWGSTVSSEGQQLRAEYERLGKSLIQHSTNIPIRNRKEFEILAEDLYDTTKSNEEILGSLNAMERIIRQSLGERFESATPAQAPKAATEQQTKPPLDSFYR